MNQKEHLEGDVKFLTYRDGLFWYQNHKGLKFGLTDVEVMKMKRKPLKAKHFSQWIIKALEASW